MSSIEINREQSLRMCGAAAVDVSQRRTRPFSAKCSKCAVRDVLRHSLRKLWHVCVRDPCALRRDLSP